MKELGLRAHRESAFSGLLTTTLERALFIAKSSRALLFSSSSPLFSPTSRRKINVSFFTALFLPTAPVIFTVSVEIRGLMKSFKR